MKLSAVVDQALYAKGYWQHRGMQLLCMKWLNHCGKNWYEWLVSGIRHCPKLDALTSHSLAMLVLSLSRGLQARPPYVLGCRKKIISPF